MSATSQVEPTDFLRDKIMQWGVGAPNNAEQLKQLQKLLYTSLEFRTCTEQEHDEELAIRWRRTGSEVLEDGYVFQTKSCTDLVVAYLALLHTLGIPDTRFVKLLNERKNMLHSIVEVKLSDGWYHFDVANWNALPQKGEVPESACWGPHGEYRVWKKGRDAWDLGLSNAENAKRVY